MQYKGTKQPLAQIAQRLNVEAVVSGSVLRSGNRVRITAVLIRVATGQQLWAKTYERNLGDVLDLENEVARAIAGEVQAKVTAQEHLRLARNRSVNADAYDAYLKGRYYYNRFTVDGFSKSIEYFEQAIKLDPDYAAAYAGLADALASLEQIGAAQPEDVHPRALEAASKALAMDDALPEAHAAMASVRANDWERSAAEREAKRAIELNPGFPLAHLYYSNMLRHLGRREESIAEARRALELDPLSPLTNEELADAQLSARQYDAAIEQYQKTLELYPNQAAPRDSLGWAYVYEGKYEPGNGRDSKEHRSLRGRPEPFPGNRIHLRYDRQKRRGAEDPEPVAEHIEDGSHRGPSLCADLCRYGQKGRSVCMAGKGLRAALSHDGLARSGSEI